MLQLIYVSIAAETWDQDFSALCALSSGQNVRNEITGVIIFDNKTFLHALEGPTATVEDTFIRIIKDSRHHALRLLSRRTLAHREFGYGAMTELLTTRTRLAAAARIDAITGAPDGTTQTLFKTHRHRIDHLAATAAENTNARLGEGRIAGVGSAIG